MKNNKGFSLIEVIIAISIMAIVAGIGSLSFSAARKQDVVKTAKVVDSIMTQVRMDNMSKAKAEYMYIYIDPEKDDYCYKLSNTKVNSVSAIRSLSDTQEVICSDTIVIAAGTESSTNENPLLFVFIKSLHIPILLQNVFQFQMP